MTVSVHNRTNRAQTFQLLGGDADKVRVVVTTKSKSELKDLSVPRSVTVGVGEVRSGLPNECAADARARGLHVFVDGEAK